MSKSIQVLDSTGVWREAIVLSDGLNKKLVHFVNFTKKHDGEYDNGALFFMSKILF
jgi:hypothetical protein